MIPKIPKCNQRLPFAITHFLIPVEFDPPVFWQGADRLNKDNPGKFRIRFKVYRHAKENLFCRTQQ